jgi:hypothetical protein
MPATSRLTWKQTMTDKGVSLLLLMLIPLAPSSGQTWVDSSLSHLEHLYTQTQQHKTVEALVYLDSTVKAFVDTVDKAFPGRSPSHFDPDRYKNLGLFINHYTDEIGYTEEFLVEAHSLNSNSPLRPLTLYSTILGVRTFHGLGEMPNLDSALAYVKEFPRGPYAKEVYAILGDFYKDLYMLLRDYQQKREGEERYGDYKYDCFEPYVDKSPIKTQRDRAQKLAIQYYDQALKLDPANADVRHRQRKVRDGSITSWSFCAD